MEAAVDEELVVVRRAHLRRGLGSAVVATALEEQYARRLSLREAGRERRARRAGADDDDVVRGRP
jgi:GNAT superfamily N-acetyltransferase